MYYLRLFNKLHISMSFFLRPTIICTNWGYKWVLLTPNRQKVDEQRLMSDDILNGKVISSNLISGSKQTASESL